MSKLQNEVLEQYISAASRRRFLFMTSKVAGLGAASMVAVAQSTSGNSAANDLNVLNYALALEFLEASYYTQFLGSASLPSGVTSTTGLIGTVTGNPRAFTVTDLLSASGFQGFPTSFSTGLFNLLIQIRDHELTHVAALIKTIQAMGGTPTQPCTYTFPVTDIASFLKTAQALENTGVSAYDGAINMISNPALIQTSATIATVEARHASFLNLIAGGGLATGNFQPTPPAAGAAPAPGISASPFPSAFDTPLPMATVLQIAGPFQNNCPAPLPGTGLVVVATPAASSSAPFSVSQITLDLSNSSSGTNQPVQYAFSIPANASAFCPAGTGMSGTSTGTTTGTATATSTTGLCALKPAILTVPGSPKATIQFVAGSGYYPVQVVVTDSAGRMSSQVLVLAYQAAGGPALPASTPGMTSAMPSTGTGTGGAGSGG